MEIPSAALQPQYIRQEPLKVAAGFKTHRTGAAALIKFDHICRILMRWRRWRRRHLEKEIYILASLYSLCGGWGKWLLVTERAFRRINAGELRKSFGILPLLLRISSRSGSMSAVFKDSTPEIHHCATIMNQLGVCLPGSVRTVASVLLAGKADIRHRGS